LKKTPSIIHIIDSLEPGGAEHIAVMAANLFSRKQHKVALMYFNKKKNNISEMLDENIELHYFKRNGKFNYFMKNKFFRIIENYDLLHVHLIHNLRYVWFISLFSNSKLNIFFHDHGFSRLNFFQKKITEYALTDATYICVNQSLTNFAEKNLGVKKSFILENMIDPITIREDIKSSDKIYRFVLVSNLLPKKNILFAIKYFVELSKTIQNSTLDIIGNVFDAEYFEICKRLISKNGLEKKISFIHDKIQIQPILNNYHFGLHMSKKETGPLVLLEYLSQGLPFLSFMTGQVSKKINRDFPSFFINDFIIDNWVEKTLNLKTDIGEALTIKMKAYYQKNYSTDDYYNHCIKIYLSNLS